MDALEYLLGSTLFLVFLAASVAAYGIAGIVIGRRKDGSTAGHFWIGFFFGVFGLCWLAAKPDEDAAPPYLLEKTRNLERRIADLEARLDAASPGTKKIRASDPALDARRPFQPHVAASGDAERLGYRKHCRKCKVDYDMREETCPTCHGPLAVVNRTILQDRF